jgi:hypothetical protein
MEHHDGVDLAKNDGICLCEILLYRMRMESLGGFESMTEQSLLTHRLLVQK